MAPIAAANPAKGGSTSNEGLKRGLQELLGAATERASAFIGVSVRHEPLRVLKR